MQISSNYNVVNSRMNSNVSGPQFKSAKGQTVAKSVADSAKSAISYETSVLRRPLYEATKRILLFFPAYDTVPKSAEESFNIFSEKITARHSERFEEMMKEEVEAPIINDKAIKKPGIDEDAKAYMDTAKKYLDRVGIEWIQDEDGLLIISDFNVKGSKDIDYNKLFKCIKAVIGHCNLAHVDITDYGNLQHLCGGGYLNYLVGSMGNIETIGIDIDFGYPEFQKKHREKPIANATFINGFDLKSTGKLRKIGGSAYFEGALQLEEVPNLEYVNELILHHINGPQKEVFKNVNVGKMSIL